MTTDAAQASAPKRKKGRSPSYPGIALDEALGRAREVYDHEGRHTAPVSTLLEHWGYGAKSGQGNVVLAALIKFGLLVDEGSGEGRRARLSGDALRILLDEREDSDERSELIRTAALRPTIHRQLWSKYDGSLPSDPNLRHFLMFEKGFTESGVNEFIGEFRRTASYARLADPDSLTGGDEDSGDEGEGKRDPALRSPRHGAEREPGMTMLSFQISDRQVEIAVPGGPLTKGELGLIREYLTLQERVAPEQREDDAEETPPAVVGEEVA